MLTASEKGNAGLALSRRELMQRQSDVPQRVAYGKSNGEIARILGIELSTVKKNLEHMFEKLGVENCTAAASFYWNPP